MCRSDCLSQRCPGRSEIIPGRFESIWTRLLVLLDISLMLKSVGRDVGFLLLGWGKFNKSIGGASSKRTAGVGGGKEDRYGRPAWWISPPPPQACHAKIHFHRGNWEKLNGLIFSLYFGVLLVYLWGYKCSLGAKTSGKTLYISLMVLCCGILHNRVALLRSSLEPPPW